MATLYGHNLGCGSAPSEIVMMTQIVELEQELSDWQQSLPPPLFLRSSANLSSGDFTDDYTMERFRMILTLRYLHVQLLLHRPSLTRSLGNRAAESGLSLRPQKSVNQMQAAFNRACVRMAEEVVEINYVTLTTPSMGRHLIGAWWFTLYYSTCIHRGLSSHIPASNDSDADCCCWHAFPVFNAALVIFGSLLLPEEDSAAGTDAVSSRVERTKQFLDKAIEALVRLDAGNHVLNRCVDYLKQLVRLADGWCTFSLRFPGSFHAFHLLSPLTRRRSTAPPPQMSGPPLLHHEHPPSIPVSGDGGVAPDLFARQPIFFEESHPGFEDELELGHYFATEFQRWFEQFPAQQSCLP